MQPDDKSPSFEDAGSECCSPGRINYYYSQIDFQSVLHSPPYSARRYPHR